MIRLPDLDTPGLPKPKALARPLGRYEAEAGWGGPASLGPAALQRAEDLRWGWEVVDVDEAEHNVAGWLRQEDERFDATVQALEPRQARGFAEGYANGCFRRARTFKTTLPEIVWPAIDDRLAAYEQRMFARATAVEDNAQASAARERLDESLQATLIPAAVAAAKLDRNDPDKSVRLGEIEAQAARLIDSNPAMAPHEKEARKESAVSAIHTAFAEALPVVERRDLHPSAVFETVGVRLRWLVGQHLKDSQAAGEAAGQAAADNPDGFSRDGWLAAIRQHRPDLAEGRSNADILALRSDAELSAEMREAALSDYGVILFGHGHQTTPGTLYLAHILSPTGAIRLLDADPRRMAADIDAAAARAWPKLFFVDGDPARPQTVEQVIAAAEEAMGNTGLTDWRQRLFGAEPGFLEAAASDADETAAQTAAAARLEQEEAYQAQFEVAEQAIDEGRFGLVELQKAQRDWLRDGDDVSRLLSRILKRSAASLKHEKAIARYTDRAYRFDSASAEDREAVDLIYDRHGNGNGDRLIEGDAEANDFLRRVVNRTGILPTAARQALKDARASDDEAQRQRARAIFEGLSDGSLASQSLDYSLESLGQDAVDPDPPVPEIEREIADVIANVRNWFHEKGSNGRSVADAVALADELSDVLYRSAIKRFGDDKDVEDYDQFRATVDEGLHEIRGGLHRYIEEIYAGRSQVEIDNRKAVVDLLLYAAMAVAPGGRRRGSRGGRDSRRESETPGGHDSLPTYVDPDTGLTVVEVKTTRQRSSDADPNTAERKALNDPEANTIYKLDNGKEFKTNSSRFVEYIKFKPVREMRKRNSLQTKIGAQSRSTDHGGHLQAARLGGSSDRFNLFEQDANFNLGRFKRWENHIYRNIDDVEIVKITLIRKNPKESRPDALKVEWVEAGRNRSVYFRNEPGG